MFMFIINFALSTKALKLNNVFTNSAPLGRVGHRVAMSVVVCVCVSVCAIAKHPLPEVV